MKPGLEQQRLYFSEQFVENWRSAQKQLDFSELLAEHWHFLLLFSISAAVNVMFEMIGSALILQPHLDTTCMAFNLGLIPLLQ
jgi:hypothetical protein